MWNWFRQKFIPPHPCISLIYHADDEKDVHFFKDALESTFNCKVVTHPWLKENPFTLTTQAALDRDATLILFMLSHIFLEDLDEQPENGLNELYRRTVGPQPDRPKSMGKAIIVDKTIDDNRHQDKYKAIFKKLNPPVFYKRDEPTKKSFTDIIGMIGKLPRRSGSSTGLMKPMAADGVVLHDKDISLPVSAGVKPSLSPVSEHLWLVPDDDEHQKPAYEPSAVRPDDSQEVIVSRRVLDGLYQRFREEGRGRPYQILHGLPGIGKTAIALHYAYRYGKPPLREQSNMRYRVVLWLDTKDGLDKSFSALSQYPSVPQDLKENPSGDGIKKWLQEKVEKELLQNNERWLLIIDGCTDFTSLGELYPRQSGRGDILITTHEMPNEARYTLEVQQLSDEDGVKLLAQTARRDPGADEHNQEAIEIVQLLNGLPLAIQLAGFLIAGLGTYKSFLDRYKSEEIGSSLTLGERVTRPFKVLLEEIGKKNDKAYQLLIRCALLGQKPLPSMLIKQTLAELYDFGDIDFIFEEVKRTLSSFSLLKLTSSNNEEEHLFVMPSIVLRLIHEMTIQLKNEDEQKNYAEQAVEAVNAALPQGKWDRWSNWHFYLPHVHVCIKYIYEFNITNTIMTVRLLYATGCFYTEQSQYELPREPGAEFGMNAEDLLLQALRRRRKLLRVNPQDSSIYPDLFTCRYRLAELYHRRFLYEHSLKRDPQKTYKKVESIYKAALAARSSSQGISAKQPSLANAHDISSHVQLKNVDTVSILNNLGCVYDDFDKHEEAKEKFTEALAALERLEPRGQRGGAGAEERLTKVVILNNLAVALMKASEFGEAKKKLDSALSIVDSLKQELDRKNSDPSVKEQMKRCDDYNQQCRVNQAMLAIVQAVTERRMPLSTHIRTVSDTLPAIWPDIKKVSEIDYLQLIKRFNNVAEFYRLRKEEGKALPYYKQAIDASVIFWEHEREKGEMSFHPTVASVLDSFEVFIRHNKFSELEKDRDAIAVYEQKVSEVRASVLDKV